MITKINNKEADQACKACQLKYSALGFDKANIAFAYEFQGYVSAMIETYNTDIDMEAVFAKVTELMIMLKEENK